MRYFRSRRRRPRAGTLGTGPRGGTPETGPRTEAPEPQSRAETPEVAPRAPSPGPARVRRIDCIGGGPGGLYFALLARRRDPRCAVRVYERDTAEQFPGWGVVLDADIREQLTAADARTAAEIDAATTAWDTIDVLYRGTRISSTGYRFKCIGRQRLLEILRRRCQMLGVEIRFGTPVNDIAALPGDLIVAADGVGSAVRQRYREAFAPTLVPNRNRYLWCGTPRLYDRFSFILEQTPHGWVWAQAYRYDATHSTFIVECSEETYARFGDALTDPAAARATLESIFAATLGGAPLETGPGRDGRLEWRLFQRVSCGHWYHGNIALLGDAAHTAHFSVGSGTKLALEDAIALARNMFAPGDAPLEKRLQRYQQGRAARVAAVQQLADNSNRWFEHLPDFADLPPEQLSYLLLTRTRYANGAADRRKLEKALAFARASETAPGRRAGGFNRLLGPLNLTVSPL